MQTSFYFAHPTSMYNTNVERDLERAFQARFPASRVENPNQPQHSEGYQREGMDYFVRLCDQQDGVFFAPFSDGSLGAGVVKEIDSFLKRGAPVYGYDPAEQEFEPVDSVSLSHYRQLDVDSTRARLRSERADAEAGQGHYHSLQSYADHYQNRVDCLA